MPYYYTTHNTQLAVHSPRSALSVVSSVSPVLQQVVRLLRTAFTIVGISALVNGVSISSAGMSSASVSAPDSDVATLTLSPGIEVDWPSSFLRYSGMESLGHCSVFVLMPFSMNMCTV